MPFILLSMSKTRKITSYVRVPLTSVDGRYSLTLATDDADLWHGAPIAIQLVGRQFEDERLLSVSALVDDVINGQTR